jgi:transcriptional regulator with XRE-family HTH domain
MAQSVNRTDPPPPKSARRRARGEGQPDQPVKYTSGSGAPAGDVRSIESALGYQVRALRRERELSVQDLAFAAGISIGMLSKIENGQASASLSTVAALAAALNAPVTSLFMTYQEKKACSHIPKGRGPVIEKRGSKAGHVYQLLGTEVGADVVVEPYLITLAEDAVPYTGFRHFGVEFIYMLTGEVIYRHADQDYRLKPGDSLLFDSGALHGPQQLIRTPMTFLSIIIYSKQLR